MYEVVRDTREQEGWDFVPSENCVGTFIEKLDTGDYSIRGYEDIFTIERKGKISEFVTNINEKRFDDELKRLDEFKHPFVILEFTMDDVMNWPISAKLPPSITAKMRVSKYFLLKKINEYMVRHKAKIIFAGKYGKEFAASLFKRMVENEGHKA